MPFASLSNHYGQRVLFSTEGQAVVFMEATDGRLSITTTHVIFYTEAEDNLDTHVDFKWPIDQLREVYPSSSPTVLHV